MDKTELESILKREGHRVVFVRIGNGHFRLANGEGYILVRTLSRNGYPWEFEMSDSYVYINPDNTE